MQAAIDRVMQTDARRSGHRRPWGFDPARHRHRQRQRAAQTINCYVV